ncbi:hypothetical protein PVAND_005028 [Polypedilum vanderplanki]|uniref:Lipocalin/cytosolic fatty-acid binding domain-containing protein n=1 Tax=Polypedilum vanderplanki TaxID=319348 RepID=A0A9J6BZJ4_POLVA|nr:hypothetical protein PVAND_005028 [Polypedilum vanderplanki]
MTNFDLTQFLGTWYGICSYPDKLALDAKCASATFAWAQNQADGINILSRHVSFGKEKKFMGMARIITSGVLGVEFPCCPKANAYYNILDTDYNNYAVIFSCNNYLGIANGQNVWILSRRRILEPQFVERTMQVLNMNGISKLLLKHIDQNCENPNVYPNPNVPYGRPYY